MSSYQVLLTALLPTSVVAIAVLIWLAPREQTAGLRRIADRLRIGLPSPVAVAVANITALILVVHAVPGLLGIIVGNPLAGLLGAACLASAIGLFMRRPWALIVPYILFAWQAAVHVIHLLPAQVLGSYARRRTWLDGPEMVVSQLSEFVERFFAYWGVPEHLTAAVISMFALVLLRMTQTALPRSPFTTADLQEVRIAERRKLGAVAKVSICLLICAAALALFALFIHIQEGGRNSPGAMGPGIFIYMLLIMAAAAGCLGAAGLITSLIMMPRTESEPATERARLDPDNS